MASQLSPKLFRGALVTLGDDTNIANVIQFQYNPNTLNRSLEAQITESQGGGGQNPRFKGAPVETISVEIEIDATDDLEQDKQEAIELGIHPQLAALEILLYPKSSDVKLNNTLLNIGTIEIIPPTVPMTLFIWGVRRILPVRITEFSIVEDAHDVNLNPIRAKVSLGLRVLSYSDLSSDSVGWNLFISHQIVKENLAVIGRSNASKSYYQNLLT